LGPLGLGAYPKIGLTPQQLLHKPQLPNTTNPFLILNIKQDASITKSEIKKAYRRKAQMFHPDIRLSATATEEERIKAHDDFARVNAAYAILTGKTPYQPRGKRRMAINSHSRKGYGGTSDDAGPGSHQSGIVNGEYVKYAENDMAQTNSDHLRGGAPRVRRQLRLGHPAGLGGISDEVAMEHGKVPRSIRSSVQRNGMKTHPSKSVATAKATGAAIIPPPSFNGHGHGGHVNESNTDAAEPTSPISSSSEAPESDYEKQVARHFKSLNERKLVTEEASHLAFEARLRDEETMAHEKKFVEKAVLQQEEFARMQERQGSMQEAKQVAEYEDARQVEKQRVAREKRVAELQYIKDQENLIEKARQVREQRMQQSKMRKSSLADQRKHLEIEQKKKLYEYSQRFKGKTGAPPKPTGKEKFEFDGPKLDGAKTDVAKLGTSYGGTSAPFMPDARKKVIARESSINPHLKTASRIREEQALAKQKHLKEQTKQAELELAQEEELKRIEEERHIAAEAALREHTRKLEEHASKLEEQQENTQILPPHLQSKQTDAQNTRPKPKRKWNTDTIHREKTNSVQPVRPARPSASHLHPGTQYFTEEQQHDERERLAREAQLNEQRRVIEEERATAEKKQYESKVTEQIRAARESKNKFFSGYGGTSNPFNHHANSGDARRANKKVIHNKKRVPKPHVVSSPATPLFNSANNSAKHSAIGQDRIPAQRRPNQVSSKQERLAARMEEQRRMEEEMHMQNELQIQEEFRMDKEYRHQQEHGMARGQENIVQNNAKSAGLVKQDVIMAKDGGRVAEVINSKHQRLAHIRRQKEEEMAMQREEMRIQHEELMRQQQIQREAELLHQQEVQHQLLLEEREAEKNRLEEEYRQINVDEAKWEAEESRQLEVDRLAEEDRRIEIKQQETKKRIDEQRQLEDVADAEREAEKSRQLESDRLAYEDRLFEMQQQESKEINDEQRRLEEEYQQNYVAEAEREAEESHRLEADRIAEEDRRIEMRQRETKQMMDEQIRLDKAFTEEEYRLAQESREIEERRLLEEQRVVGDQIKSILQDEKRLAEEIKEASKSDRLEKERHEDEEEKARMFFVESSDDLTNGLKDIKNTKAKKSHQVDFKDVDLVPMSSDRFQVFDIENEIKSIPMITFTRQNGIFNKKGRSFYQLTKPEDLISANDILLRRKDTGEMFTGSGTIEPPALEEYDVFAHSTSFSRKLVGGTKFIYEM
jgi:hypothetical protein